MRQALELSKASASLLEGHVFQMIQVNPARGTGDKGSIFNSKIYALLIAYFNLAMSYELLSGSQNKSQALVIYRQGHDLAT